jgi:5-formyltetrahydrofolate cyclo-ligase
VHPAQLLPAASIPRTGHDVAVDLVVTPEEVVEVVRTGPRPTGRIVWEELTDAKLAAIPILQRLHRERGPAER